jgi:hypothetical protein
MRIHDSHRLRLGLLTWLPRERLARPWQRRLV